MNTQTLMKALMSLVPPDGTPIGNMIPLRKLADVIGQEIPDDRDVEVRDALVASGQLAKGTAIALDLATE